MIGKNVKRSARSKKKEKENSQRIDVAVSAADNDPALRDGGAAHAAKLCAGTAAGDERRDQVDVGDCMGDRYEQQKEPKGAENRHRSVLRRERAVHVSETTTKKGRGFCSSPDQNARQRAKDEKYRPSNTHTQRKTETNNDENGK